MSEKHFKNSAEYLLAIKKASDSNGKIVDERMKLNTDLVKSCPKCQQGNETELVGKLYYCSECNSFWYLRDIRTDELKADMIYDYPAKLAELLKRRSNGKAKKNRRKQ